MRYLGACGFEFDDNDANGIVIDVGGFFVAPDIVVPPTSKSTRSQTLRGEQFHRPWHTGSTATSTPRTPSGTRWGFQMFLTYPIASDDLRMGVGVGAGELITLVKDATTGRLALWLNGAVAMVAPVHVLPVSTWKRYTVDVDNQVGGFVRVYVDGDTSTPVLDYTLPGPITNPTGFWVKGINSSGINVDDMLAWEFGVGALPDLLDEVVEKTVEWIPLTGNGNYTDWGDGLGGTGDYTAIDERPFSDADLIESTAVDEASTFTITGTTEDTMAFCQVGCRVRRTGTDAGTTMQVRARQGGTDADQPAAPTGAPADGHVIVPFDTDPNGANWTPAVFNATEFGPVTRT